MAEITGAIKVGILGGTGLDDPDLLEQRQELCVDTPFGKPSDVLITGRISGVDCVLLARHGRTHNINPTNVNYRANIWALKQLGCTHVLAATACGSLREDYRPGDIVILDQFIDRTTKREQSFYDGKHSVCPGVSHIPAAEPYCHHTRQVLLSSLRELEFEHKDKGTILVIEGPRFSTKAESFLFQSWNADVIGMTAVPEVILAKEAGLCYASVAMVTDYDCWKESADEQVSVEAVLVVMRKNAEKAIKLLCHSITKLGEKDWTGVIEARKNEAKSAVMGGH